MIALIKDAWDSGALIKDAVTWDDSGNNKAYLTKAAAMIYNTGSVVAAMRKDDPDLLKNTVITTIPKGPQGRKLLGYIYGLIIPNTTKNPDLAKGDMKQIDWSAEGADVRVTRTVMRDGHYINTVRAQDVTLDQIINMMVGRTIYEAAPEVPEHPSDEVVLDVRHLNADKFRKRFPGITRLCEDFDIDVETQRIPVRPAAHSMIGGVMVEVAGPLLASLPAAEPCFWRLFKRGQDFLMNLPVPGQQPLKHA